MESLVFAGNATFDRQCVNIIILNDDISEGRFSEFFTVGIRAAEGDENEVLLQRNSTSINVFDDDRKLNFHTAGRLRNRLHKIIQSLVLSWPTTLLGPSVISWWQRVQTSLHCCSTDFHFL